MLFTAPQTKEQQEKVDTYSFREKSEIKYNDTQRGGPQTCVIDESHPALHRPLHALVSCLFAKLQHIFRHVHNNLFNHYYRHLHLVQRVSHAGK